MSQTATGRSPTADDAAEESTPQRLFGVAKVDITFWSYSLAGNSQKLCIANVYGMGGNTDRYVVKPSFYSITTEWPSITAGTRLLSGQFGPKPTAPSPAQPGSQQAANIPKGEANPWLLPPQKAHPSWPLGQQLSMHVHLSTSPTGDVFSAQWTSGWRKDQDADLPSFVWDNIKLGDWDDTRAIDLDIKLPEVSTTSITFWCVLGANYGPACST